MIQHDSFEWHSSCMFLHPFRLRCGDLVEELRAHLLTNTLTTKTAKTSFMGNISTGSPPPLWCAFRFGTETRFGSATPSTLTKDLQRFQDPHHLPQHFQCPVLISSTEIGHHCTSVFTPCGSLWHSWIILNRLTQHCQYNPLNFSAKCKIILAPLETRQLSFSALLECRVQVKVYADPLRCDQSWRRPLQPLPPGKSSGPMATLITCAKPLSADKTSNLVTQNSKFRTFAWVFANVPDLLNIKWHQHEAWQPINLATSANITIHQCVSNIA